VVSVVRRSGLRLAACVSSTKGQPLTIEPELRTSLTIDPGWFHLQEGGSAGGQLPAVVRRQEAYIRFHQSYRQDWFEGGQASKVLSELVR